MQLTDKEKLFVMQGVYNAIGEQVATKNPGNLRDAVGQEYIDLYEQTGAKSFDAKVNGEKVGTFSLTISKPTDSKPMKDFVLVDEEKFKAWKDFHAAAMDYAENHLQQIADWHFGMTGEMPEGCEMQEYVVAGKAGGEVERTTLKIDTKKVAEAVGGQLPEVAQLLLEGGKDD